MYHGYWLIMKNMFQEQKHQTVSLKSKRKKAEDILSIWLMVVELVGTSRFNIGIRSNSSVPVQYRDPEYKKSDKSLPLFYFQVSAIYTRILLFPSISFLLSNIFLLSSAHCCKYISRYNNNCHLLRLLSFALFD